MKNEDKFFKIIATSKMEGFKIPKGFSKALKPVREGETVIGSIANNLYLKRLYAYSCKMDATIAETQKTKDSMLQTGEVTEKERAELILNSMTKIFEAETMQKIFMMAMEWEFLDQILEHQGGLGIRKGWDVVNVPRNPKLDITVIEVHGANCDDCEKKGECPITN